MVVLLWTSGSDAGAGSESVAVSVSIALTQVVRPNALRFCCRGVRRQPRSPQGRIHRAAAPRQRPRQQQARVIPPRTTPALSAACVPSIGTGSSGAPRHRDWQDVADRLSKERPRLVGREWPRLAAIAYGPPSCCIPAPRHTMPTPRRPPRRATTSPPSAILSGTAGRLRRERSLDRSLNREPLGRR